jgi:hypothetical protein
MNYEKKYLKYKNKYIQLQKELGGGSNNLNHVNIAEGTISIADKTYYYNDITSVTIPDSVTSIGKSAFEHNKLKNIKLPKYITLIPDRIFN